MKKTSKALGIATLAIALVGCSTDPSGQNQGAAAKPNVLFIMVDDMGWGDVGVFWQNRRKQENDRSEPWQSTPALDELAATGAMLTNHYTAAPVCAPSRASLLLGLSQGHANVRDNQFDKALEDNYTLGSVMQEAGYNTATIGKWGLQGGGREAEGPDDWPAYPLNRGFDYYLGYVRHRDGHEHYPKEGLYRGPHEVWENDRNIADDLDKSFTTDLWTAAAKKYITEQTQADEAKPFFLYLAYDTPHAVLELATQAYPEGGGLNGGLQWTGEPGHMINTASGTVDSYIFPEYASATYDHDKDPSTPEIGWPETYQRYASSCRRIDEGIGDLVTLLKDLGIYDNTIVVFTSDNGPSREDYLPRERYVQNTPDFFNSFGPFDGIKRDTWEGGLREPTIVSWPAQIPANQVIDEPSAMYDWMATLAEAAGVVAPARTDGVSLLPMLTGQQDSVEHLVYVEYFNNQPTPSYEEFAETHRGRTRQQMQMLRVGDFAGVRYDIQSATDDFEIYNVVVDPQETTNLATDTAYQDLQNLMKRRVLQIRRPDADAPRPYDSALVPGVTTEKLKSGVRWSAYEGSFPWVANVSGLTPTERGTGEVLDAAVMEQMGMLVWKGMIRVPEDGEYEFSFTGAGEFVVKMHEALLIDGSHGYQTGTELAASTMLQAGFHPFQISFLKKSGQEQTPKLEWSAPGRAKVEIPAESFYRE